MPTPRLHLHLYLYLYLPLHLHLYLYLTLHLHLQPQVQVKEEAAARGLKNKDKASYELLKRCYVINYEHSKHEYRIKKGPHIMCADPLCHKIFASDEAYVEHVEEMQRLHSEDPSKVCIGV